MIEKAGSPVGAWRLSDAGLVRWQEKFRSVGVMEAAGRLYFIESEQRDGPGVVEYDPVAKTWARLTFSL